jgi:hypothetical protein
VRESLHLVVGGGVLTSKSVVEVRREWVQFLVLYIFVLFSSGGVRGRGGTVLQRTGGVVRCAGLDFWCCKFLTYIYNIIYIRPQLLSVGNFELTFLFAHLKQ